MPPTSQFFQVPASGEFKKLEPVREHRQCLLFLSGKGFTFPAFGERIGNFFSNVPMEGALLYLQLTSETAEKGGEKVLDHAFQRRREIERMLLSGKRLTVSVSDGELRETQMTNYFSNLYPIDCAVLSVNAQSYRKYGTLPEHEFLPEI